jgi:DNA-binding NarL/FixJ family response regulator
MINIAILNDCENSINSQNLAANRVIQSNKALNVLPKIDNGIDLLLTKPFPSDISFKRLRAHLNNKAKNTKLIAFIENNNLPLIIHLYLLGADGIIKTPSAFDVNQSIKTVLNGYRYVEPDVMAELNNLQWAMSYRKQFTDQEYEIYARNTLGYKDDDIANALWISLKTVKNAKSRAHSKYIDFMTKNKQLTINGAN